MRSELSTLTGEVREHTKAVADMSDNIGRVADNSENFMKYHGKTIPVSLMLIIIAVITLAFAGAEGLRMLGGKLIPLAMSNDK